MYFSSSRATFTIQCCHKCVMQVNGDVFVERYMDNEEDFERMVTHNIHQSMLSQNVFCRSTVTCSWGATWTMRRTVGRCMHCSLVTDNVWYLCVVMQVDACVFVGV
jgi:hypothetical protein